MQEEQTIGTEDPTQAASGIIVNAVQMQSIDINGRFTRTKTENGWQVHLRAAARITVTFTTSMRKFETTLIAGDLIERDGDDLILIRNHPPDAYRSERGGATSPLARATTPAPTEGRTS